MARVEATAAEAPRRRRWYDILHSTRPLQALLLTLIAAIFLPFFGARLYTGEIMWPLFIAGYAGAALAFTTALFWDRHQRLEDSVLQREADRQRAADRLREEQDRRMVEARRRFGAVELELLRLKTSVDRTKLEQHHHKHFFPDLPTGSWEAASGPLAVIVSDYELMADLSTFYGHVEELRWRLRFKAQADTDEEKVNSMIDSLAESMAEAVDALLEHVREQIQNPQVEHVVGAPATQRPRVARRRQFTGAIRARTPEEIERALAQQRLAELEGPPPEAEAEADRTS